VLLAFSASLCSTDIRKEDIVNNIRIAHFASLVCFAGSTILIIYGLLAIPFPYAQNTYGWDEILLALGCVGMIGGTLGLLALDAARPRWLAATGAVLAILGFLGRIVLSAVYILVPHHTPAQVALGASQPAYVLWLGPTSILLMMLGLTALSIAIPLGKQLISWRTWTPLIVLVYSLVGAAFYTIDQYIHFILLGLWGIPWLLVGYVVFTHAAKQRQAIPVKAPGVVTNAVQASSIAPGVSGTPARIEEH
jgi:hypothetical protein